MTTFVDLDIRPILRDGGEPFGAIMNAVSNLGPGEGLRLLVTFEPVPLFSVMESKGFTHEALPLENGEWEVLFSPATSGTNQAAESRASAHSNGGWREPVRDMDNRELDPPEPMVRILAAVEEMREGEVLCALLCREPLFLFPELEKRGHRWRGGFEPDGKTYRILIKVAG